MNGFSDQLKKWQDQIGIETSNLDRIESQGTNIGQLPVWRKALFGMMGQDIVSNVYSLFGYEKPREIMGALREHLLYPEVAETKIEYENTLTNLSRAQWFTVIYQADREALKRAGINSFEDYASRFPPETGSSMEDLQQARAYINKTLAEPISVPTAPMTADEAEIEKFLTEKEDTRPHYKGIHLTTVQEMVQWLSKQAPEPILPEDVTQQELIDYLKEKGMLLKPIHCLGQGSYTEFEYYDHPAMRSTDSVYPVLAAAHGIDFTKDSETRIPTPHNFLETYDMSGVDMRLVESNIEMLKKSCRKRGFN